MRLRLKSPASRLFIQPFIQAEIKENIKAPLALGTGEFPAELGSNAEKFPFDDVIMKQTHPPPNFSRQLARKDIIFQHRTLLIK